MTVFKKFARLVFMLTAIVSLPFVFQACADESEDDDDRCALVSGVWTVTSEETSLRCEDNALLNAIRQEAVEGDRTTTSVAINQKACAVTVNMDGKDIADKLWGYLHFDGENAYDKKGLYGIANAIYDKEWFEYKQHLAVTFEKDGSYFEGTYEHDAKSEENKDCKWRFDVRGRRTSTQ